MLRFENSARMCGALGLGFKASKDQPPDAVQKLQGVQLELRADEAVIQVTSDRARRLDDQLKQILLDDKLVPHEAASVAGKLQFVAQSLFGKSCAAALRPFYQRAQAARFRSSATGWTLNQGLRAAIEFLRLLLRQGAPRVVRFFVKERVVIYADAFFELGGSRYTLANADQAPDWGRQPPATFNNGWGFVVNLPGKTVFAAGRVPM